MKKIVTSIVLSICLIFSSAITSSASGLSSIPESKYYQERLEVKDQ